MTNAFKQASKIERKGMEILTPYLKTIAMNGQVVLTHRGVLSFVIQKSVGDVLYNLYPDGDMVAVEIKVEESQKYGNLFLETWSNKSRYTPGWMFTTKADRLWYFFLEERQLLTMSFGNLRHWAFVKPSRCVSGGLGRLFDFEEKRQGKYVQMNDTWGRCVPIEVIREEVNFDLEETI